MSNVIQFPSQPHSTDKRAAVEALARELGGFVVWADETREPLTPRETEALLHIGRIPRPTLSIAVDLYVSQRGAYYLLAALARKGYAQRVGKHVGGGWIAVAGIDAPHAVAA